MKKFSSFPCHFEVSILTRFGIFCCLRLLCTYTPYQILRIFYCFQIKSLKTIQKAYIKDLLSFRLLIIQHDQLISFCDLNICKFINKNRLVELPVSTETLVHLMTLTLKLDLLLRNFNLGHNFLTRRDRAFILHMCIPCDKTFHIVP